MTPEFKKRKIEYINKFNKDTYQQVMLHINKKTEADILAHLNTKKSKNGYIKDLIRKDMNRAK